MHTANIEVLEISRHLCVLKSTESIEMVTLRYSVFEVVLSVRSSFFDYDITG